MRGPLTRVRQRGQMFGVVDNGFGDLDWLGNAVAARFDPIVAPWLWALRPWSHAGLRPVLLDECLLRVVLRQGCSPKVLPEPR